MVGDDVGVPTALVDLIGAIRPGVGHPVTGPADMSDTAREVAADRGVWKLADALVARGMPASEARSLARMCSGVDQIGQLGATVATTRCVVGFHRSTVGHYAQLRRPGLDGLVRVSIESVSRSRLVHLLEELLLPTPSTPRHGQTARPATRAKASSGLMARDCRSFGSS